MEEFRRVPRKGRVRANSEKLFGRVLEKGRISVSTKKWYIPGEYWENVEYVRIPKNYLSEYWKRVESV